MPATALIMVDVINSFYEEGQPNYYPWVTETLEPIAELLATARDRGTIIVHSVERHHAGFDDYEFQKLPRHHIAGDHDAEFFPGFAPRDAANEVVIPKRRYSGFFATDLALTLREQGVDQTVIVGVKTNVCIRATAQDAFANGFRVVIPREATNSNRRHLEAASLEDVDRYFGEVVDLTRAKALL